VARERVDPEVALDAGLVVNKELSDRTGFARRPEQSAESAVGERESRCAQRVHLLQRLAVVGEKITARLLP
jgi:hypothetical protein